MDQTISVNFDRPQQDAVANAFEAAARQHLRQGGVSLKRNNGIGTTFFTFTFAPRHVDSVLQAITNGMLATRTPAHHLSAKAEAEAELEKLDAEGSHAGEKWQAEVDFWERRRVRALLEVATWLK